MTLICGVGHIQTCHLRIICSAERSLSWYCKYWFYFWKRATFKSDYTLWIKKTNLFTNIFSVDMQGTPQKIILLVSNKFYILHRLICSLTLSKGGKGIPHISSKCISHPCYQYCPSSCFMRGRYFFHSPKYQIDRDKMLEFFQTSSLQ